MVENKACCVGVCVVVVVLLLVVAFGYLLCCSLWCSCLVLYSNPICWLVQFWSKRILTVRRSKFCSLSDIEFCSVICICKSFFEII